MSSRNDTDRLELPYRILSGDDSDERACQAIPDSACTDVPRNYLLNVANGAATKLAEQLASPGLVLPWVFAAIGAPAVLSGLLMPAKQAGSLLPQIAVAGRIRAVARRKWVWTAAGAIQAGILVLIALAALAFDGWTAGLAILVLFALFSLASGMGSVAFQDVVGKTIPKGRRGRLLANRAAIGGALTLAVAGVLQISLVDREQVAITVPLILAAAVLWLAGAVAFAALREEAGATSGGRTMISELGHGVSLFRQVAGFRRYILVRCLMLGVELAMPFYVLHAAAILPAAAPTLALYVFAVGGANIASSPFWGRFSDTSSRTVLTIAGGIAAAAGLGALGIDLLPEPLRTPWLYALLFFALGVAESGVRIGRKTYLVDAAPDDERPLYVAFSNTTVGLVALCGGLLGLLADLTAPLAAVLATATLAALGMMASRALPEPADMFDKST
ncbi:MAG: MFS transporter [Inquilinus sp.]|nr:MFS transporter [Inquilinus sp.]